MAFRLNSTKKDRRVYELRRKARTENKDPSELPVYTSAKAKTGRGRVVSKTFNSIAISKRLNFSVRMYGKPYLHNGVMTKRYDVPVLLRLLAISRPQLYRWIDKGILPSPFIRIQYEGHDRVWWLYHQVQPVVIWYGHMKARGITRITNSHAGELALLQRMLVAQEKRFLTRMGVKYVSRYQQLAGVYGVIPLDQ